MTAVQLKWLKVLVFILCLLPFVYLLYALFNEQLGANGIEVFTRRLGEWGLQLLLVTLCMTPLRHILGNSWPIKLRRMLGLYAFFYICLHLLAYLWMDQFFDWGEIGRDIIKRPFITFGMLSVILLIPLAITSTNKMQRRLGRRWVSLHRLIYPITILGVLHFYWLVKADLARPHVYALVLLLLLVFRLVRKYRTTAASKPA